MKITKARLQQIIKEEVAAIREEEPVQLELPGMDVNQLLDNAANYFNLLNKGEIKENYDADIALINLWDREKIYSENMHSKGKYTPFEGMTFDCRVDKTILRGNVIMDREGSVEKKIGYGQFIEVK